MSLRVPAIRFATRAPSRSRRDFCYQRRAHWRLRSIFRAPIARCAVIPTAVPRRAQRLPACAQRAPSAPCAARYAQPARICATRFESVRARAPVPANPPRRQVLNLPSHQHLQRSTLRHPDCRLRPCAQPDFPAGPLSVSRGAPQPVGTPFSMRHRSVARAVGWWHRPACPILSIGCANSRWHLRAV